MSDRLWVVEMWDSYAQLAEIKRLEARVAELEFGAHGVTADELRAENKRLREAGIALSPFIERWSRARPGEVGDKFRDFLAALEADDELPL